MINRCETFTPSIRRIPLRPRVKHYSTTEASVSTTNCSMSLLRLYFLFLLMRSCRLKSAQIIAFPFWLTKPCLLGPGNGLLQISHTRFNINTHLYYTRKIMRNLAGAICAIHGVAILTSLFSSNHFFRSFSQHQFNIS